ncbi:MAG: hypothetical protein P8J32_08060, partial [bacterium]|nr:hypothetical protein [bacterium]
AENAYGVSLPYTCVSGLLKTWKTRPELSQSFAFMNSSFQEEQVKLIFQPEMIWSINRGVAFAEHKSSKWSKINGGKTLGRQERIAYAVSFFYAEALKATTNGETDFQKLSEETGYYLDTVLTNHSSLDVFFEFINNTLS